MFHQFRHPSNPVLMSCRALVILLSSYCISGSLVGYLRLDNCLVPAAALSNEQYSHELPGQFGALNTSSAASTTSSMTANDREEACA